MRRTYNVIIILVIFFIYGILIQSSYNIIQKESSDLEDLFSDDMPLSSEDNEEEDQPKSTTDLFHELGGSDKYSVELNAGTPVEELHQSIPHLRSEIQQEPQIPTMDIQDRISQYNHVFEFDSIHNNSVFEKNPLFHNLTRYDVRQMNNLKKSFEEIKSLSSNRVNPDMDKVRRENHYLLVYGTTIFFGSDDARRELQELCIESMVYIQEHYPIKYIVFERNPQVIKQVKLFGLDIVTKFEHNEYDMPTVRGVFKYLESHYDSDFFGYINGDIVQSTFLYESLLYLSDLKKKGLIRPDMYMVGQRHDYLYTQYKESRNSIHNYDVFVKYCSFDGLLHRPYGMDYFISTPGLFTDNDIDPLVVGRKLVDNYLLSYVTTLSPDFQTIDLTRTVISIHVSYSDIHKSKQKFKDKWYNQIILQQLMKEDLKLGETSDANYILKRYKSNNTMLFAHNKSRRYRRRKSYLKNPYKLQFKPTKIE